MTKSRQSATKLRLSRLIRCLVALGCLKLIIMGVAMFDLPMPAWRGDEVKTEPVKEAESGGGSAEFVAQARDVIAPVADENEKVARDEAHPQGMEAAELAAAAKPRRYDGLGGMIVPAPLAPGSTTARAPSAFTPTLPAPAPLGAPLARAGVVLPEEPKKAAVQVEDGFWNMLDLKSLPIPGLGSVSVARAASEDMPVPATPKTRSPFAPAEQMAPLGANGGGGASLPGAPPLPANIPNGLAAPLPPRQYAPAVEAPAPNVTPQPSPLDPNVKTQEMARQQQDILMLRQQMDQRLKDLQTAEEKMKETLREARDVEDKKVKSLVLMYANMKPRMAAQAMEKMDERIAVRILAGMAPKQSGEILTYTNPAKTAKFTEMLTRLRMNEM